MKIAVFGLGYVGVVSAACLADQGHEIVGVEVNPSKVDAVNAGRSPVVEPEVESLLTAGVRAGRLRATSDWTRAVAETDMAWVCVGTPSRRDGGVDCGHLLDVCRQIGGKLRARRDRYTVVVRSTALPGTTRTMLIPAIELESGRRLGNGWGICYHPEFLREGSSVGDFFSPSLIVVGALDDATAELVASLYSVATVRCGVEEAEMVKYAGNAWHGMKVAFANEIGTLSKAAGLDGRRVMEIFCLDRKLNISEAYLKPAFAFGGSCLPKDLRALNGEARRRGLDLPLLGAVQESNERHIQRALQLIVDAGVERIGLAGFSFKAGTDDLRESPFVELAARLVDRGLQVRVYDPEVDLAGVTGANREYLASLFPDAGRLLVDGLGELVAEAELVVIGHLDGPGRESLAALLGQRAVIDLEGALEAGGPGGNYQGVCW